MKATGARVSRKVQRTTKVGVSNDPQWYLTVEDMPYTKEAWLHFLKKVANRWEATQAIERATTFGVSTSSQRTTNSEASKCKKRATGVSVSPTQEQAVCTLASLTQEQATRITASFTDQQTDKQTTQSSAPKKAPLKKKADKSSASLKSKRANSFGASGDIERATHKAVSSVQKRQEQRADVFKQIRMMSLQELVSAIRIARDKAYDEQPLNSFEKFLFDKFLNHDGDIETLAQKLKGKR